jgi:ferredoxin-NADP reductase
MNPRPTKALSSQQLATNGITAARITIRSMSSLKSGMSEVVNADLDLGRWCGPTSFVESVATLLVDLGHDPAQVRTERFGPTS